jgi:hypothetical protein
MTQETEAPFVGLYFLTFDQKGFVHHQGRIECALGDGYYLVQLYSWLTGYATNSAIRSLDEMRSENWRFYRTQEAWRDAGDRESRRACHREDHEEQKIRKASLQ